MTVGMIFLERLRSRLRKTESLYTSRGGNALWARHAFPSVCKAWSELCRTGDASPLHDTLEVEIAPHCNACVEAARVIA